MSLRDELLRILEAKRASWSERDLVLAQRVAEDLASLYARKVAGEVVDGELAQAKAAASSIAAAASVTGAQAVAEALKMMLGELLRFAI